MLVHLAGLEPAAHGLGNIRRSKSDLKKLKEFFKNDILSYADHLYNFDARILFFLIVKQSIGKSSVSAEPVNAK